MRISDWSSDGALPILAAYEHKERFYGIWDATTRLQAEAALDEWIATIPKGQKEVWSDLVRAVGNWREETMTYFETDMPVTNAYTESINRLAKDKNREGRGYSFEEIGRASCRERVCQYV